MMELRMTTASVMVKSRIDIGSMEARSAPENMATPCEYLLALNTRKTRTRRITRTKLRPEPPPAALVIQ